MSKLDTSLFDCSVCPISSSCVSSLSCDLLDIRDDERHLVGVVCMDFAHFIHDSLKNGTLVYFEPKKD